MENEKQLKTNRLLYNADQTPPPVPLVLSSVQHTLLILSVGLALPVALAKGAELNTVQSAAFLAVSLFSMGITTIVESYKGKFLGCGNQLMSVCNSAAISVCMLAVEIGGLPLLFGMSIFAGITRFILGNFANKLRKLFLPEVTGAMIMMLGISLISPAFEYFIGTSKFNPMHLLVAGATLMTMLVCSLLIKPLKPYSALCGIILGYILSIITGIFDLSFIEDLKTGTFVTLPIYPELSFSFDFSLIVPFLAVSAVSFISCIGDITTIQIINNPEQKNTDWKAINCGIRASGLAGAVCSLLGGTIQATALTNTGISKSSGMTSRKIAYGAGLALILISFFPVITGILSFIPEPVLGAIIMYSLCYIMSSGLQILSVQEMDDRKIFTIFLSISAAISTMIPGLYNFLPKSVSTIIANPLMMGICTLIVISLLCHIGVKKHFSFSCGVTAQELRILEEELTAVCRSWGTKQVLLRNLLLSAEALGEGIYEQLRDTILHIHISYDSMQVKLHIETDQLKIKLNDEKDTSLHIAVTVLKNIFKNVKIINSNKFAVDVCADITSF